MEKKYFEKFIGKVDRGRLGLNKGVPFLDRLDDITGGLSYGEQYLIGAETGVGKSKFVRHMINSLIIYSIRYNKPIEIHGFFLEESVENTVAEFILKIMYELYDRDLSKNQLFSKRSIVLDDDYSKILELQKFVSGTFSDRFFYVEDALTPTQIHNYMMDVVEKNGTFRKHVPNSIGSCVGYTPKDRNKMIVFVIDTINLTDNEPGKTDKNTIDDISKQAMFFRKKCDVVPVIIQQFGAEISSVERRNKGLLSPLLRDFEDTKRTTKDATSIIGLFEPQRHELKTMLGYEISQVEANYEDAKMCTIHLIKNRDDFSNRVLGTLLKSKQGIFYPLPQRDLLLKGDMKYSDIKSYIEKKYISQSKETWQQLIRA